MLNADPIIPRTPVHPQQYGPFLAVIVPWSEYIDGETILT